MKLEYSQRPMGDLVKVGRKNEILLKTELSLEYIGSQQMAPKLIGKRMDWESAFFPQRSGLRFFTFFKTDI